MMTIVSEKGHYRMKAFLLCPLTAQDMLVSYCQAQTYSASTQGKWDLLSKTGTENLYVKLLALTHI